jgi:hypothetical protein
MKSALHGYAVGNGRATTTNSSRPCMVIAPSARRWRSRVAPVVLAITAVLLVAADVPDVRRVRVPADKALSLFPPKSELRWLPRGELESLVRLANERASPSSSSDDVHIIRIRSYVRWDAGCLYGRTDLTVQRPTVRPSPLRLDPWTPAGVPFDDGVSAHSTDDGRIFLWLEPKGPAVVSLAWEARAREGSNGLSFDLGLPKVGTATLVLDLPDGFIPSGPPGIRQGPAPSSEPSRRIWRFDGPSGTVSIQLRGNAERGTSSSAPRLWVGGKTLVEVSEASARWQAQWTVDPGTDGPRRFVVAFDPGLDVFDVEGPGVASYQSESPHSVSIRLSDGQTGPASVTIHGVAKVPDEGSWDVPSARPLDAVWLGGRTNVRLGPSRALEDCHERAGRRVAARPEDLEGEERGGRLLVFDSATPRSVAALTLRRSTADVTADVRGRLLFGRGAPQIEAILRWRVARGRVMTLAAELPPGWDVDRVELLGHAEAVPWIIERRPQGGSTLRALPPASLELGSSPALFLSATGVGVGSSSTAPMPRVRAIDARVADEVWLVKAEPGDDVIPGPTSGLSWMDPASASADPDHRFPDRSDLVDLLAWRWNSTEWGGVLDRRREPISSPAEAWTAVSIDRRRVRFDWYVVLDANDSALRELPIRLTQDPRGPLAWQVVGEQDEPPVPAKRMPPESLEARGMPGEGPVYLLDLTGTPSHSRRALHARLERPWSNAEGIPLIVLPPRHRLRGQLVASLDPSSLATFQTTGLRALDGTAARRALVAATHADRDDVSLRSASSARPTFAYAYDRKPGKCILATEPLRRLSADGVIEEAVLTSFISPEGQAHQRLMLSVWPSGAESLTVTLPTGTRLESATNRGEALTPAGRDRDLVIPLETSSSTNSKQVITLEYSELTASRGPIPPSRPEFSLPCLAFRWEIDASPAARLAATGSSLVDADPTSIAHDPLLTQLLPRGTPISPSTAPLHEWNQRVFSQATSEEMSLGDLLLRWDVGDWPLVLDRDAVASAGVGPGTAVRPRGATARRAGSAPEILESLGLIVIPMNGVLLVTSRIEAEVYGRPEGPLSSFKSASQWAPPLLAAAGLGSDSTDRFQSVVRWRETAGPSGDVPREDTGENFRRFVASGWPARDSLLSVRNIRAESFRGLATGLIVILLGVSARRLSCRRRALGLAAALLSADALNRFAPGEFASEALGLLAGVAVVSVVWLGDAARPTSANSRDVPRGRASRSSRRRVGSSVALVMIISPGISLLSPRLEAQLAAPSPPIVVLFPYDGPPDPAVPSDRAVMLLKDYERLRALASNPPAPQDASLTASSVEHGLRMVSDVVVVESQFQLHAEGQGPWIWRLPLGDARDLSALVDGRSIPVQISADATAAFLRIPNAGEHKLTVRRSLTRRVGDGSESVSLPINPVPSSRFRIREAWNNLPIEVPNARGRIRVNGRVVEAALGSVERLEIRWGRAGAGPAAESSGDLKGMVLWDVEPAGDRVRARWLVRGTDPVSQLRLALDPGLIVRSASSPGVLDISSAGTSRKPEWIAHLSPPLRPGESLAVEFFRPAETAPALELFGEQSLPRSLPKIEPLGPLSSETSVAIRRPKDWAGRLELPATLMPMTEAEFLEEWGELSDNSLSFVAAARGATPLSINLNTGPASPRRSIRPEVHLAVQSGRINILINAHLSDRSGRTYGLLAQIPPELRLVSIEADGLTYWTRTSPDKLRLRFDGESGGPRSLHIEGWIPLPPALSEIAGPSSAHSLAIPWPAWPGSEVEPGTLTVSAPRACEVTLDTRAGVSPIRNEAEPSTSSSPLELQTMTYRVDRSEGLGRLIWRDEPPRVSVRVDSLLTVADRSAVWNASARYSVSGGPVEVIRLKVPTPWAEVLEIESPGARLDAKETDGSSTIWTVRLDRPIWGTREFLLRAEKRLSADETLTVPDLVPQGRGTVETYVAIDEVSGRDVALEGSSGLQPVEPSRFESRLFPMSQGVRRSAFKVSARRWTLRVRAGEAPGEGPEATRINMADYTATLANDGSVFGRVCFDLEPRPGRYLSLEVPSGVEPLGAEVDGSPAPLLARSSGPILIPLRGRVSSRVIFVWHSLPASTDADGRRTLLIPTPSQPGTPMLFEVLAPEGTSVDLPSAGWEHLAPPLYQVERLEGANQRVLDRLERIDRSSSRERSALLGDLVRFEVLARMVSRSVWYATATASTPWLKAARQARARADEARATLSESLRDAGLEDLGRAALGTLGLAAPASNGSRPDRILAELPVEPTAPRIGISQAFHGVSAAQQSPRIRWRISPRGAQRGWDPATLPALGVLILTIVALAFGLIGRSRRWLTGALLIGLIGAMVPFAGWCALGLIAFAFFGYFSSRNGPVVAAL